MGLDFPLRPEQASTVSKGVDYLFYFLTANALFFAGLIFLLIFVFAIRYRRRSKEEVPENVHAPLALEIGWTVIPAVICVVMFVWSAALFFRDSRAPQNSLEIFVVGKQWMWQIQHPEGIREINELHVPVNRPVKLIMTSQDVIHDFFIPAFRVKKDVLPDRYTSIWFEATETGKFHLFCAQYCGMGHSKMGGWVYVMPETEYEKWLTGGTENTQTMADAGAKLYNQYGCVTCHGTGRAPAFNGLYQKPVQLSTGASVTADDAYLRESILDPSAKIVNGYPAIMPTFKDQLSEEQVLDLIAFIRSLGTEERNLGKP